MRRSKSTRVPSEDATINRRRASDSSPTSRRTDSIGSSTGAGGPEWTTHRWKLQVEAEARNRLKKSIRDVGTT
jgi:hypothetical protein